MNNFDTFYMSEEEISSFKKRAKSGAIKLIFVDCILVAVAYSLAEAFISKNKDNGALDFYFSILALWMLLKYMILFCKHMKFLLYGIGNSKKLLSPLKKNKSALFYATKSVLKDLIYPYTICRAIARFVIKTAKRICESFNRLFNKSHDKETK
ncbi:MAG: hypothetical protein E7406_04440 [Ruminococcaceae bacterium]|nr:hypothetical protein [Oscillospiraceae bacterium]